MSPRALVFALTVLVLSAPVRSAEKVLLDSTRPDESVRLEAEQGATISRAGAADAARLLLHTPASKGWPGLRLVPKAGRWDLSAWSGVEVAVRNVGKQALRVFVRVDNPGADGRNFCLTDSQSISPGRSGTVRVELKWCDGPIPDKPLFGMRGYPSAGGLDLARVVGVQVFMNKPARPYEWEVLSVKATGRGTPAPAGKGGAFFPLIDTFGQYKHRDWPGKTHSLDDLQRRRAQEQAELDKQPGPSDWDRYGGWQGGPKLDATGFFRVQKHKGKWWLVDPEGRLFWSHGIDCVLAQDHTPIDERDAWFEDFPGRQSGLSEFLGGGWVLKGHYAGRQVKTYSFSAANLKRKYGDDWRQDAGQLAHRRLRSWGMNTVANWSNRDVARMRRTPYVATVNFKSRLLEGSSGYWGKFRDVFDESFERDLARRMAAERGQTAGDPWCVGYFVDNEIAWGNETSLALGALKSPSDQPAKKAFIDELRGKYQSVEKLNAAWAAKYASWQAMIDDTDPKLDPAKARADLEAFYTRTADRYFSVIRAAVKKVAPNQLYLGCRFAWVNPLAAQAGARHCDVVSYNLYRRSVADFKLPGGADVPLIIGEFHFGALDRGMFHTGLVPCKDQADRAAHYRDYVGGCMKHPAFVGCHWFKYQDEPTTGRTLDEENYQIGFIDAADTPYPETVQASREVGYKMYRQRMGE